MKIYEKITPKKGVFILLFATISLQGCMKRTHSQLEQLTTIYSILDQELQELKSTNELKMSLIDKLRPICDIESIIEHPINTDAENLIQQIRNIALQITHETRLIHIEIQSRIRFLSGNWELSEEEIWEKANKDLLSLAQDNPEEAKKLENFLRNSEPAREKTRITQQQKKEAEIEQNEQTLTPLFKRIYNSETPTKQKLKKRKKCCCCFHM